MAAIASTNVTYSLNKREEKISDRDVQNVVTITFGNGVLTYPTGGVPLTIAGLGLRSAVSSFKFIDGAHANGYVYKYDLTNNKIVMYYADYAAVASGALIEVDASVAPASAVIIAEVNGV